MLLAQRLDDRSRTRWAGYDYFHPIDANRLTGGSEEVYRVGCLCVQRGRLPMSSSASSIASGSCDSVRRKNARTLRV